MLGGAGTLALAAPVGVLARVDHPDATLIALGAEYDAAEAEMARLGTYADSFPTGSPVRRSLNERSDLLNGRLLDIIEEAAGLRATTHDGIHAKLAILRDAAPFGMRGADEVATHQNTLVWSLVRDMAEARS